MTVDISQVSFAYSSPLISGLNDATNSAYHSGRPMLLPASASCPTSSTYFRLFSADLGDSMVTYARHSISNSLLVFPQGSNGPMGIAEFRHCADPAVTVGDGLNL